MLATGVSGKPNRPVFPGQETFAGEQQHSSEHPGPDAGADKRVVVIGSNHSAFDICGALYEVGADVTMVQRSSSHIVRSDSLMEIALRPLYSEEAVASGVTTERADMTFASIPYRIMAELQVPVYEQIRERDQDFYARLEAAGFEHDWGDDYQTVHEVSPSRVGVLHRRRRRRARHRWTGQASRMDRWTTSTEHAVVLADGTELPADLVVFATGYGSMNGWVADLVDQETADRLGKVWGLGSDTAKDPGPWEGEQRNMWKPTQVENLWMHGGNLHQSRHYSLYLALQLKARAVGLETPVYGLQEVHHTG